MQTVLNVSSVQDGTFTLFNLLLSLYTASQMICTVQESALCEPVWLSPHSIAETYYISL